MDKNRIVRPTRWDELAQHSKVPGSVVAVNAAVVLESNALLPGEILRPHGRLRKSAEAIVANSEPEAQWGLQRKKPEDSMS